jgi:hypothetical protein
MEEEVKSTEHLKVKKKEVKKRKTLDESSQVMRTYRYLDQKVKRGTSQ